MNKERALPGRRGGGEWHRLLAPAAVVAAFWLATEREGGTKPRCAHVALRWLLTILSHNYGIYNIIYQQTADTHSNGISQYGMRPVLFWTGSGCDAIYPHYLLCVAARDDSIEENARAARPTLLPALLATRRLSYL